MPMLLAPQPVPTEILLHIASYLDIPNRLQFASLSRGLEQQLDGVGLGEGWTILQTSKNNKADARLKAWSFETKSLLLEASIQTKTYQELKNWWLRVRASRRSIAF
jgi:hypothetical protein